MAGPWEKYGASSGPWVKYQSQQPAQDLAQQVPFDDPGALQSVLIGAGRTFDRIGKGVEQGYYAARSALHQPTTSDLVTGGNEWDRKLAALKNQADEETQLYRPLQDAHPIATGIGESLPSMAIPAGGSATLIGNAARMAAAGAIPGALEYGSAEDRLKRAAIGGAAGAAIPVIGAGVKTLKAFTEPLFAGGREKIVGRVLNQVAGDDAANVLNKLKSAAPLVPGSMPTAAQVAENGGIAAMERAASQANPQAYTNRAMEQASARLNALRSIAGDDAAMAAAKAARDKAAGGLYDAAFAKSASATPDLVSALDRLPGGVLAEAKELAKMSGQPLKDGVDVPAQMVASGVLDAAGNPIMSQTQAQMSKYSGRALHYIKMALDDAIGKTGDSSMGNTAKRLATGLKGDLLSSIEQQIPEYGAANATFAELSKPVNQMNVGRELLDKLQGPLADFGGLASETGATYARGLRNAAQTLKNATGMKNLTLDKVMTPDQIGTLNGIAADLARKANAQNLGRGVGSDTFQKLSMNNIAQQSGLPRLAGGLLEMPGISRATRWIYQDSDQKAQGLLADALLNPQEAAGLMEKVSKQSLLKGSPKARKALQQSIMRAGLLAPPYFDSSVQP